MYLLRRKVVVRCLDGQIFLLITSHSVYYVQRPYFQFSEGEEEILLFDSVYRAEREYTHKSNYDVQVVCLFCFN